MDMRKWVERGLEVHGGEGEDETVPAAAGADSATARQRREDAAGREALARTARASVPHPLESAALLAREQASLERPLDPRPREGPADVERRAAMGCVRGEGVVSCGG